MAQCDKLGRFGSRTTLHHQWICLLLVTPILLVATSTLAASRQVQERAARKACLSGDYAKGVSILSDLFVATTDPTYIFNQARCFEQNRRYEDAIARFQEYLRAAPDLDAADKTAAEKHIADCQDLLGKPTVQPHVPVEPAPPMQAPVAQQPPALPPPASTPVLAPAIDLQQANPRSAATPGSGLRAAGVITASIGGAGIITGVALNLKVNSMATDMENLGNYSASKESQRKTYETIGWIGYSVGAACIATGAVLYYLGVRTARQNSATLALLPLLAPNHAGASLGGTF